MKEKRIEEFRHMRSKREEKIQVLEMKREINVRSESQEKRKGW